MQTEEVTQIKFLRKTGVKIFRTRKESSSNTLYNTITIVMVKLKEDIQRINFEVPIEYSNARALKETTKSLPDWDEKSRELKTFNLGWERILVKN